LVFAQLPGISEGTLFRKNVRQALGITNKVNKALKQTINGENPQYFFLYKWLRLSGGTSRKLRRRLLLLGPFPKSQTVFLVFRFALATPAFGA